VQRGTDSSRPFGTARHGEPAPRQAGL
jgi:hypothetical protein